MVNQLTDQQYYLYGRAVDGRYVVLGFIKKLK